MALFCLRMSSMRPCTTAGGAGGGSSWFVHFTGRWWLLLRDGDSGAGTGRRSRSRGRGRNRSGGGSAGKISDGSARVPAIREEDTPDVWTPRIGNQIDRAARGRAARSAVPHYPVALPDVDLACACTLVSGPKSFVYLSTSPTITPYFTLENSSR